MACFEQGLILTCGSSYPFLAIGVGVAPLSSFICNYEETTNNCKGTAEDVATSSGMIDSKLVDFVFFLHFLCFPDPL